MRFQHVCDGRGCKSSSNKLFSQRSLSPRPLSQRHRRLQIEPLEERALLDAVGIGETEPNNALDTAGGLLFTEDPSGSGYYSTYGNGTIDPAVAGDYWSDPDYWSFSALADDVVSISIDTPDSDLDPYVELRNVADGLLASDNDSGSETDSYIGSYTIPTSGQYFVRVGKEDGSATPGAYQLRIDLGRGIQLENDPNFANDAIASAEALNLNPSAPGTAKAAMAATIATADGANTDEDYFRLGTLDAGSTIELDAVLPAQSTLQPRMQLVDSSGAPVTDTDGDASDGHFLAVIGTSGEYYAVVDGTNDPGAFGQYLLDVDLADPVAPTVLQVDGLPAEGTTSEEIISSFTISFSEQMDPDTVNNSAAFDLREAGVDELFDTADDTVIEVVLASAYTRWDESASFWLQAGPLGSGEYRFSATATLTDRIGNAIDGNADGTGGDAYTQFFTLDLPADFVLEAPYNDTPEGATPLTLAEDPASSGYLVAHGLGSIDPAVGGYNQQWNESDYWSFDALAGDKVAVSIDTPESNLNSYVYLYDEAGNGLAGDNDSGPGGDAYISYHEIPSDGTYYVRVGHYAYDATVGNYQLRVDVARGIDLESDAGYNNDSIANADPITLSESGIHRTATAAGLVMGPESSNQDEDIYALGVLNVGNVVELDTRLPGDSSLAPRVRLLDASGNVVADEDGDATDGHFLATISEDGFYYAIMDSRCWVYNGHRYQLTESLLWEDAETVAQGLGGHLATIDDAAEQEFVHTAIGTQDLWIGINDAAEEGTWVWADGTPVAYTNWYSGEPNSGANYDYGYINASNGQWYDGYYNWSRVGLVEWDNTGSLPDGTGPGTLGRYLLDVDISDPVPPRVTDVSRIPAEGATTEELLSSFQVTVSEELNAETVNTPVYDFVTYGGHTYVRTSSTLYWSDAEAFAENLGGHLVTIDDQAEQDFIYTTFGTSDLWIGMNDLDGRRDMGLVERRCDHIHELVRQRAEQWRRLRLRLYALRQRPVVRRSHLLVVCGRG